MALTSFWLSSEKELASKHVQAMVGLAGEGKLRDNGSASSEFREFLSVIPLAQLSRYATECLGEEKFADGGRALQDIINEVGRRLGFVVKNGLYQGKSGSIGYDGLWYSGGASIVVEVKTTDTYSIDLDTLAEYRHALIEAGRISGPTSSILIVVGRTDTGSWEAQVRGSRHAWDIRLISVQALLRLMQIKHELDDPSVIERIQTVLRPREFTKLDEIVELVFYAAEDVKKEAEIVVDAEEEDEEENEPGSLDLKKPKFIPVNFRDACATKLAHAWKVPLIKRSFAHYSSADESVGVFCLNSREHKRGGLPSYWFALHPHQVDALRKHSTSALALGCGTVDYMIVIPLKELEQWLPKLWTTVRDERSYWHLVVIDKEGPKLRLTKPASPVDLSEFVLR
ncbi:MAG TPA: hypothetical protein VK961_23815 [Chthoniobacter sp.]|nr:hypothetical protein [Chthoniobacter sp.]